MNGTRRKQLAAYLFIVLVAMVSVATYDSIQRGNTETRIIERIQPRITQVTRVIETETQTVQELRTQIEALETLVIATPRRGSKGVKGDDGAAGIRGATGPQGVRGPRGPQGERGPEGKQGPPGQVSPSVDPAPSISELRQELEAVRAELNALRSFLCSKLPPGTC